MLRGCFRFSSTNIPIFMSVSWPFHPHGGLRSCLHECKNGRDPHVLCCSEVFSRTCITNPPYGKHRAASEMLPGAPQTSFSHTFTCRSFRPSSTIKLPYVRARESAPTMNQPRTRRGLFSSLIFCQCCHSTKATMGN